MPKSKRSREGKLLYELKERAFLTLLLVALTQTDKRSTREHKTAFIQDVRESIDKHNSLYLFSYENMRSSMFKDVRLYFRGNGMEDPSRLLLGKNKLMQIAFGRTPEEEYGDNLRHVAKRIRGGNVGILFTNKPRSEVESYFSNYRKPDFARAGSLCDQEVLVTEDEMKKFPVSMMEQLRKLGMPVEIQQGNIVFRDGQKNYRICKAGQKLSAEQSKLLVHFDIKASAFSVRLVCRWSDGEFDVLDQDEMEQ